MHQLKMIQSRSTIKLPTGSFQGSPLPTSLARSKNNTRLARELGFQSKPATPTYLNGIWGREHIYERIQEIVGVKTHASLQRAGRRQFFAKRLPDLFLRGHGLTRRMKRPTDSLHLGRIRNSTKVNSALLKEVEVLKRWEFKVYEIP